MSEQESPLRKYLRETFNEMVAGKQQMEGTGAVEETDFVPDALMGPAGMVKGTLKKMAKEGPKIVKAGVDEIKDLIEKGKVAGYTKDRMRVLINTFNTGDKTKKEKIKQLFDKDAAKAAQPEVKEFVPENLGKSYKRYSGGGYTKPSNVMDYSPQPLLEQGVKKAKE